MGKNQHSKDRLYLTNTEHASGEHRGHGKLSTLHLPYRTLPYDCCAISFRPFDTPLCTADGSVFELLNIVPYLKKYHRHPVSGGPLAAGDLIKLHFHRNQDGQYACPVLYKPFTQHTHIVAIKPTGHVYCYDAVKQMNLKPNHLHDLLDETPFTRADIIHIQDPANSGRREMERFSHVAEELHVELKSEGSVRHNDATSRIMQKVTASSSSSSSSSSAAAASGGRGSGGALQGKQSSSGKAGGKAGGSSVGGGVPVARWTQTTGKAAMSFTSTSVPLQTVNEIAPLSDEEAARQRYAFLKGRKEKAYCQLTFAGHGSVNLELHTDLVPMTCENFLLLLERGYYDRTPVHRVIRNFMVQCGDPTGTGTGGGSAWGKPFKDEISNKLRHEGPGILSMANSGPDSNGSQFFLTFKSASHLDGKHTVFGRVVGGLDILTNLEKLPTDKEDRPKAPLTLAGGSVFVNPFTDLDAKMEEANRRAADPAGASAEEKAKAKAVDEEAWFNQQRAVPTAHRSGIGKYIAPAHLKPAAEAAAPQAAGAGAAANAAVDEQRKERQRQAAMEAAAAVAPEPPKKRPKGGSFGNFDGW